jgi:miniconductance mechanosensitive channel
MNFEVLNGMIQKYPVIYNCTVIVLAIGVCVIADFVVKKIILHGLKQVFSRIVGDRAGESLVLKIASRLANVVPVVILYYVPLLFPDVNGYVKAAVQRLSIILLIAFLTKSLMLLLDLTDTFYQKRENAASRPIKGYLQLGKILLIIVAAILIISFILDKSPVLMLSGLGAVAAVLMLVFQDTILSLVASIQINSNNMLKIGDWIVMPSYEVDGFVVEIALHTVKVQNWDKTIVTIPMRKLIEESFINWRGMFESGGRRIKRSIFIDQRSIRFLSDAEIKRLEEFVLLNDYLDEKQKEIAEWNAELAARGATPINGRRITNIGTFRIYVEKYLRSNKAINQDMLMLVRQLAPGTTGLPLEIYCFTKSTQWIEYEKAQADVFDHLLAILPVFGLRVFQDCSDIYQEVSDVPTFTDGVFPENNLVSPLYPSDMKRIKEIAHALEKEKGKN